MISHLLEFQINSSERVNSLLTKSDDFQYELLLTQTQIKESTHCAVISSSIPKTYYVIDKDYNEFILEEETSTNDNNRTVTLPIGNYTATQLLNMIELEMNSSSALGYTYEVSFEENNTYQNNILQIVCDNSHGTLFETAYISIIFNQVDTEQEEYSKSTLMEIMGFTKVNNLFDFVSTGINSNIETLTSPNEICISHKNEILINSDLILPQSANENQNNILAINYMENTQFGGYSEIYYDIMTNMKPFKIENNGLVRFWLTDEYENSIDIHNQEWTMQLVLFNYEENYPFYEKLSVFIDYLLTK